MGANVGFNTLLFAELLGRGPLPRRPDLLWRHIQMNGYRKVGALPCASSAFDGEVEFARGAEHVDGHLAAGGLVKLPCQTAHTLVANGEVEAPDEIKIDVEGAETDVLRGARHVIEKSPIVFLATHGETAHQGLPRAARGLRL